jgi:hypothetical protein
MFLLSAPTDVQSCANRLYREVDTEYSGYDPAKQLRTTPYSEVNTVGTKTGSTGNVE